MNTLTDINAHLFPINDGGATYHDMAAYAYDVAVGRSRKTSRCSTSTLWTAYEAAARAHDARVDALTAKFVNVAMHTKFDTVDDLVIAWWEVLPD